MRYTSPRALTLLLLTALVLVGLPAVSRAQEKAPDYSASWQPGFPANVTGSGISFGPPTLADLTGDGRNEIIIGTNDGWVHALRSDGSVLWSHNTAPDFNAAQPGCSGTEIRSAPAVGDLDGDGSPEVIVGVGDVPQHHTHGGLIVLRGSNGSLYPGWPYLTADILGGGSPPNYAEPDGCSDGLATSPALTDLDGDGKLEIVAGAFDMRVYAWKLNGALHPGWPRVTQDTVWSSPAVADLDDDGWPEIVIGSDSHTDPYYRSYSGGALWVFRRDGASLPGTPCYFDPSTPAGANHTIHSSPAVADLNSDGYLDVIIGTGTPMGGSTTPPRLYAFSGYALTHNSCSNLSGWPVAVGDYVASAPAIGDLEGNGARDVVVTASDGKVYAWRPNATLLNGFPIRPVDYMGNLSPAGIGSPVLGDLTGNGRQDIFVGFNWEVGIIRDNGQQHTAAGSSQQSTRPSLVTNWIVNGIPAIGNVDTDNALEVFIGGSGSGGNGAVVYGWQISTTHTLAWPIFRQDTWHDGLYPISGDDAIVLSHTLPEIMAAGASRTVSVVVKNTGTSTWTPGSTRLCAPQGNAFGSFTCLELSQNVVPGATATFNFTLTAPAAPGIYINVWRLRQGNNAWFGGMAGDRTRVTTQPALYVLTTDPNRNGAIIYHGGIAPPLGQPTGQGTPSCTEYTVHVAPQAFQMTTDRAGYYMVFANDRVCFGGSAVDVGGTAWPIDPRTIQDIAVLPGKVGMITLDANGTLRTGGLASPVSVNTSAPAPCGNMQTARSLALTRDGRGLYVMDARGCIYRGGNAPELPRLSNAPLPGNTALKLKLAPSGTGYYVMDIYGHVWNGGGAPAISPNYSIASSDWARDFELTPGGRGYYLLAKDGSIWTGGAAPTLSVNIPPTWPGQDVARDLELAYSAEETGLTPPPPPSLALMRDQQGNTTGDITVHLQGAGGQALTWQASLTPNVNWLRLNAQSGTTPFDLVLSHSPTPPSCPSPPCTFNTTLNLTVTDGQGQQYYYSTPITLYVVREIRRLNLPLVMR